MGQLTSWTETLATPISVWLSGLFNPMAYLTSILQVTARATGSALDAMTQETHMTVYKDAHAIPPDATFPENGAFIHGLFIEGARWPFGDEVEEPYEFGRRLPEARRRRLRGARLHHDRARRDLRVPGDAQDGRAQEQVDAHGHGAHDAAGRLALPSPSEDISAGYP